MPAPTIDELLIADDSERWSQLGFTILDGQCQLGGVRVRFLGTRRDRGIVGWSLRELASTQLDGLATTRSERRPPGAPPAHANGVVAIDHIVAMSRSLDRSVRALQAAGVDLRGIREQPTPAGAPRQAFFRLGEVILELIQEPDEVIERAGARERPTRFWGLAVRAADLDRTVELLGARCGPIRPAVQPGRRIATLPRSAGIAVPLALMSSP